MTLTATTNRQSCDVLQAEASIRIVFLRHAQTDLQGRFCGHSDPGLGVRGLEQLPIIVQNLSQIRPIAILSSDLRRARETAEPIAKHFRLDYTSSSGLREMNFGLWEGLTWKEVELQYPEDAKAWANVFPHHRPPGGESFLELQSRAVEQLEQLANSAEPGCTLVVTHAGFIRTVIGWVLGIPDERISRIRQDHGAVTILENARNHWTLAALNVGTSHSRGLSSKENEDRP